jgi:hypothetical protein
MGPLRKRILKNIGMKPPPPLDTRIQEYTAFLSKGGFLREHEKIIVGVKGGGLAVLKRIPEVFEKACQRNKVHFKIGDSVVVVDFLIKIKSVNNDRNESINTPDGFIDYVRNTTGKCMLERFILVKNIIIPETGEGVNRDQHIPCKILGPSERFEGLDIHRISIDDIDRLHELEIEIFSDENLMR